MDADVSFSNLAEYDKAPFLKQPEKPWPRPREFSGRASGRDEIGGRIRLASTGNIGNKARGFRTPTEMP